MEDPLVGNSPVGNSVSASRLWCGCLPHPSRLLIWRAEGSDRFAWKAFCSFFLVAEIAVYFYVVYRQHEAGSASPLLFVYGAFTLVKFLVETWGQDTPTWICPGGIVMFFVIYALILPFITYSDGMCTSHQDVVIPLVPGGKDDMTNRLARDAVGAALFFFGSAYSLSYEMGRFAWKKRPENAGKLHMTGLAQYCIHPNYFGDLFTYTGWALTAGTTCALSTPAGMVWSFVLLVCPNSDAYLAKRYGLGGEKDNGGRWEEYERTTATLIPFVRSKVANQVLAWAAFLAAGWLGGNCAGQCG